MKTLSFHAGEEDIARIQAEQERLASIGSAASESEAIRSLISRAAPPNAAIAAANGSFNSGLGGPNGGGGPSFRVLRGGKLLHQRVEKFFTD